MREEKRSEIIHDALHMLDDEMIEEVENLRGQISVEKRVIEVTEDILDTQNTMGIKDRSSKIKKSSWKKWTALAASVCVFIACGWVMGSSILPKQENVDMASGSIEENKEANEQAKEHIESTSDAIGYDIIEDESLWDLECGGVSEAAPELMDQGVEIPAIQVDLKKNEDFVADMVGFFIYEGRCYVQNEYIYSGADFVGNYVGYSKGLIDEWTTADGYVDGAGSIEGKFYEVKGVDPEFMLCMKWENGIVETYVNNNGITLIKGADLVENRLHLKDNYREVSFFTHEEWNEKYETKRQPKVIAEENKDVFDKFLENFGDANFIFIKDSGLGKRMVYNSDAIYHLYFTTNEGLVVQFWLLGDGYVVFQGLNNVCVQINQSVYDEVVGVLQK